MINDIFSSSSNIEIKAKLDKAKKQSFKKRLKTALICVLSVGGLFTLFIILNGLANAQRGYKSIGGEMFIFLTPFLIVLVRDTIHKIIDKWNRHK